MVSRAEEVRDGRAVARPLKEAVHGVPAGVQQAGLEAAQRVHVLESRCTSVGMQKASQQVARTNAAQG